MKKVVIGTTGPMGAGKSAAYSALQDFTILECGSITRAEAAGKSYNREELQNIGNRLREKFGDAVIIERLEQQLKGPETHILFDGLRNPGEIKYLKEKYGALIIGIDAPVENRRKYVTNRAGDADPKTDDEFTNAEARDRGVGEDPHGQQVDKCIEMADIVIENSGSENDLRNKFLEALTTLGIEGTQQNPETKP